MDSRDVQEAASASLHKQNAAQNQKGEDLGQRKLKAISMLSQIDFSKHQTGVIKKPQARPEPGDPEVP